MIRQSTDRTTVVNTEHNWIPIGDNPPRGAKLLLINRAAGVAVLTQWLPGSHWTHWHPLPTFTKD